MYKPTWEGDGRKRGQKQMKHRQRKLKKQRRRQNSRPLSKLENMCIVLDLTRVFVPFEEARQFVRSLRIKNSRQWREYCRSGKKPDTIPPYPDEAYKKEWKGIEDWLGTDTIANRDKNKDYWSFEQAREFVHSLGLKSRREWKKWCKSGNKPKSIPTYPNEISSYKKYWKGWDDIIYH
jgi:hypothetical protein